MVNMHTQFCGPPIDFQNSGSVGPCRRGSYLSSLTHSYMVQFQTGPCRPIRLLRSRQFSFISRSIFALLFWTFSRQLVRVFYPVGIHPFFDLPRVRGVISIFLAPSRIQPVFMQSGPFAFFVSTCHVGR